MPDLARRPWVPEPVERLVGRVASEVAARTAADTAERVETLAAANARIHDEECINLNPAANTMNPRAEALLASGLGSRPSLGYPGDKYEMGLEAIEQIEIIAAELAAEVFRASFAEVRVGSGALANLYAFMAACRPGDPIIVPPATIGGHVTHNPGGAADLYGLDIHEAPVDADRYTVDVDAVRTLARRVRPGLISIGGSLNLTHHPVAALRDVADEVGAVLLFDAAHLSGPIAGGVWPNPLDDGAHVMTMSAYKSLAGPPSGLLVTNDATIAERVDSIAFPGLTANFDAANTAALAIALTDWQAHGADYARDMVASAQRLATELADRRVPVHRPLDDEPATSSHAFALRATDGDGHAAAQRLRRSNLLTSAIGLPDDGAAGVRVGTNEIVRWGLTGDHLGELADLFARAWFGDDGASGPADEVSTFRRRFTSIHYCTT
ncbi:serine hydroxymethyltransferase [Ilumatobacter sp.]|uniref:serine hydroxymethyltransferase n=1 Tax=Ilumatobacter sp. TaxID=1967498 RepID=UPI003AF4676B